MKNIKWDKENEIRNNYEFEKTKSCLNMSIEGQFDDEYVYWLESQLQNECECKDTITEIRFINK